MTTRAIDIDVTAFNDVAVHGRTQPRPLSQIREDLEMRLAFHQITSAEWQEAHAEYKRKFEDYLHDPDTQNWRDQRKRRMEQQGKRDANGRRRA